jgi:hypothetical protein
MRDGWPQARAIGVPCVRCRSLPDSCPASVRNSDICPKAGQQPDKAMLLAKPASAAALTVSGIRMLRDPDAREHLGSDARLVGTAVRSHRRGPGRRRVSRNVAARSAGAGSVADSRLHPLAHKSPGPQSRSGQRSVIRRLAIESVRSRNAAWCSSRCSHNVGGRLPDLATQPPSIRQAKYRTVYPFITTRYLSSGACQILPPHGVRRALARRPRGGALAYEHRCTAVSRCHQKYESEVRYIVWLPC